MADWLTDNLGRRLNAMTNAANRGMEEEIAEFGISFVEFVTLVNCYEGTADTVTGISRTAPVDAARISRAAWELSERGLIRRERLQSDRRIVILSLTDEGYALAEAARNRVIDRNVALLEGVTDEEKTTFTAVSEKILANYAALNPEE